MSHGGASMLQSTFSQKAVRRVECMNFFIKYLQCHVVEANDHWQKAVMVRLATARAARHCHVKTLKATYQL